MIRFGLLLLILPILVLMGVYFWELGDVRTCQLDGGHWNYMESVCRDAPQPFVSWLQRSPLLVNGGMLLSVIGFLMCSFGFYTKSR